MSNSKNEKGGMGALVAGILIGTAVTTGVFLIIPARPGPQTSIAQSPPAPAESPAPAPEMEPPRRQPIEPVAPPPSVVVEAPTPKPAASTNIADRLTQIRETFRALARGDKLEALRAAKQLTNEMDREAALLALVTEWSGGNLATPQIRAQRIARAGLEAGIGMDIAGQTELAMLWANELTQGPGRTELFQYISRYLVASDPAAAFALSEQVPAEDRQKFAATLFENWAFRDTAAAMRWAEQIADPTQREQAIAAIRNTAPVGIGTELRMSDDGYPLITGLVPGMPAQVSGQLQAGDRIVALARGDNLFVNVQGLPLDEIVRTIRGAPGTVIQLQVLPQNAPPNSTPRTVSITRDQIYFKN